MSSMVLNIISENHEANLQIIGAVITHELVKGNNN